MAGAFTVVNLSQLPAPNVVETLDFETILAEILADFYERMTATGQPFTALLESDPAYKLAECAAYREILVRQRVNESAKAVMLAYATGADLDQLGANVNVARLTITPADDTTVPPTPAVMEADDDFRARIQLSPEAYTTAGSEGSYIFHALGADADVKDVQAVSPTPGVVTVYVLSRSGDGTAAQSLLDKVDATLNAETVRPMTDQVNVSTANIVTYVINAELVMFPGPDSNVVRQAAITAVTEYAESVRRIGYDVTLSGIYAALHQPGVQSVNLISPAASLVIGDGEASRVLSISVTVAGENV
jgi:phage-related baseplate assembly protein